MEDYRQKLIRGLEVRGLSEATKNTYLRAVSRLIQFYGKDPKYIRGAHHIPEWQNAVKEINRVLKPGGKFYFEEVTKKALDRLIYRTFLQHPRENRFGSEEFIQEVEKHHLQVQGNYTERFFGDFLFGVATKSLEY